MSAPTDQQYKELLAAKRKLLAEQHSEGLLSGDGDDGLVVKLPILILEYNKRNPQDKIEMPYAALYEYSMKTGEAFKI